MAAPKVHPGQLHPNCLLGPDRWRVVDYRCNYSKFNGSRHTPSSYSSIQCLGCRTMWRTSAKYVESIGMMSKDEREQWLRPTT